MPDGEEFLVFYDLRRGGHLQGGFVLVPRAQVEAGIDPYQAWRGPGVPVERFDPAYAVQVLCEAVKVDRNGYFTCKNLYPEEEIEGGVKKKAESVAEKMADMRAAEAWSTPWDELVEEYGDVYAVATFGDATAVDGEILWEESPRPPAGYEEAPEGGAVPSDETYVDATELVRAVHETLAQENAPYKSLPRELIEAVVEKHFEPRSGEISWSVSGETEIWVPREEHRQERARARRAREAELRRRGVPGERRRQDWTPARRPEKKGREEQ